MPKLLLIKFILSALKDALKPVKRIKSPDPVVDERKIQIWMIGHATMLINFYGTVILTDPVFGKWLPFPRRIIDPGLKIKQLPKIDFILQSHMHWDHFHIRSVKKIANADMKIIMPEDCADLTKGMDFKAVVEMKPGETREESGVKITTYRPHHWGKRVPWEEEVRGYNSYVLEKNSQKLFFCGDSGYGPVFREVYEAHGSMDISLLPIGAYDPPSVMKKEHMDPEEALQAKRDLDAKIMIPFHFGNFRLSEEPMDEPVERLLSLISKQNIGGVQVLYNGRIFST